MTYIALEDIGDYKKGDTVPDVQAIVWNQMYKNPVCVISKKEEVEVLNDFTEQKPKATKKSSKK